MNPSFWTRAHPGYKYEGRLEKSGRWGVYSVPTRNRKSFWFLGSLFSPGKEQMTFLQKAHRAGVIPEIVKKETLKGLFGYYFRSPDFLVKRLAPRTDFSNVSSENEEKVGKKLAQLVLSLVVRLKNMGVLYTDLRLDRLVLYADKVGLLFPDIQYKCSHFLKNKDQLNLGYSVLLLDLCRQAQRIKGLCAASFREAILKQVVGKDLANSINLENRVFHSQWNNRRNKSWRNDLW